MRGQDSGQTVSLKLCFTTLSLLLVILLHKYGFSPILSENLFIYIYMATHTHAHAHCSIHSYSCISTPTAITGFPVMCVWFVQIPVFQHIPLRCRSTSMIVRVNLFPFFWLFQFKHLYGFLCSFIRNSWSNHSSYCRWPLSENFPWLSLLYHLVFLWPC